VETEKEQEPTDSFIGGIVICFIMTIWRSQTITMYVSYYIT